MDYCHSYRIPLHVLLRTKLENVRLTFAKKIEDCTGDLNKVA